MKITDVKTHVVYVPFEAPIRWALGVQRGTTRTIAEVFTDEGVSGLGETIGSTPRVVIEDNVRPAIVGEDPFNIEHIIMKSLWNSPWVGINKPYALPGAAVEVACWDIIGKKTGRPICDLIGGRYRNTVEHVGYVFPRYVGSSRKGGESTPDAISEYCSNIIEKHGFKTLEMKVGIFPPEQDVRIVKAIRERVGYDAKLRIDANSVWSTQTAISTLKALEKYEITNVEDPTKDLESMAIVRKTVNIPFSTHSLNITEVARLGAADAIVGDVHDSGVLGGGILPLKKLIASVQSLGLDFWLHSSNELGISMAAVCHVISSTPVITLPSQGLRIHLADDVIKGANSIFQYDNGCIQVPKGPGLGVEVDDDKIEKYTELHKDMQNKGEAADSYFGDITQTDWRPPYW